ncbi:S9 family peptidase [Candidatus Bathyarchaeota archaeon]|nr:S9 family peptidase [Candidatus Bathyarchaeota archaeon]
MKRFQKSLDSELLFRVPSVFNYDVSPKSDMIAFSWNKSGQVEIYVYGRPTAKMDLVTKGAESKISPSFAPNGKQLAYTQDYQGDENFDIFLLDLPDGKSWNVTPDTSEAIYPRVRWSPDAKKLAFASNREKKFSIYTMPSSGGKPERISSHKFSDSDPEWSPDGKWLAFNALVTAQDYGVFLVPSNGGEIRRLTENDKPIEASSPEWSPDGKEVAFMSAERGSSDIGIWNPASGSVEWVTDSRYECYDPKWSPDGHRLAYEVNRNENVSIAVQNRETRTMDILEVEPGDHSQIDFGSDLETMFFIFSGPRHPPDLWSVNLKNRKFRQLTNSLPSTIDQTVFVTGTPVHFSSNDGLKIPALLYLPKTFDPTKHGPSLVYIHGGPTAQHTSEWNPSIQHLINRGYIIIAPNYRGSSGYGRKFREANRFVLGGKDLEDVVAAADYLVKERLTDPKRIGVLGGSYGGYLTMCALTKFPEYWAVGAAMVPFLNWFTEIENEREDLQVWDRENMGDPKKDHDRFMDCSPIFFIDRIKVPVQLIAGAHDPRCPVSETKQAQKELQKLGKVFDLVIFEDEGHGLRKLDNRVNAYKRRAEFLDKHLNLS